MAKTIEVSHTIGDTKDGQRVLAVTIDHTGEAKYKLDDKHTLVFVGEDKNEATFACSYCNRSIAFVLPGLGEPSVIGDVGDRRPPDDYMTWMDACGV